MPLQIPHGTFRAYLFDCDGTIVDSMPLHYTAWKQALGEWGCTFDESLFYSWGGRPTVEIVAALNQMQGLNMPAGAITPRPLGGPCDSSIGAVHWAVPVSRDKAVTDVLPTTSTRSSSTPARYRWSSPFCTCQRVSPVERSAQIRTGSSLGV